LSALIQQRTCLSSDERSRRGERVSSGNVWVGLVRMFDLHAAIRTLKVQNRH
jgi:hypothetical protein